MLNWNVEFLNLNSQRAYPLTETATRKDITGSFTLPDDFLLGLYFPVHPGLNIDPTRFFLYKLGIFGGGFTIAIGYQEGESDPEVVAAAVVSIAGHTEYRSYAMPGQGDFDDCVGGKLVLGKLDGIANVPAGQYTFDYAGGALEVDCIRPYIRYVSSFAVSNNGELSDRLYGDIVFQAGSNIRLTAIPGDIPTIRIDAISGEGLTAECICDDERSGTPIKTINGIEPTTSGDFELQGDTCLTLVPLANGLQLKDECSQPCCGCPETQALQSQIAVLVDAETTVRAFISRLEAEWASFTNAVLGSRLMDSGCQADENLPWV